MGTDQNLFNRQIIEEEKILWDNETLESFTAAGFRFLVEATKKSNNLSFGKARDLYESCPSFHSTTEKQAGHVLSMLSTMLKYTNRPRHIEKKDDEDKFEVVVDSNDALLENVGILLDELSGVQKTTGITLITERLEPVGSSLNEHKENKTESRKVAQVLNMILNQTKHLEKPQLKFKDRINNDSSMPFEPKLTYKYNMLKPLAFISEKDECGLRQFTHPYEFELEKFQPLPEQLTYQSPILYKSLEETPLVLVSTPDNVQEMVKNLEKCKELAIDLEGFTCLLQISTRDTDYIIDTLSLRSDLEELNKVFTNPRIVKVFHGADLDVLWLQRDLALYIVNMFDTYQAAKSLNFPKLSLGYLLSHYCKVNAQKEFQLADWRVRPLPQELLTYARGDTHYLLFIYDNLRNLLIEKANHQFHLLKSVISESTKICLKRYLKPIYKSDGYLDLYRRSKKLFDNRQKFALRRLFEWRDAVARESDESYAYVLPDHMMLNISEVLPREAQGILACCNPVPALIRQNLVLLHQIILKAREQPLVKPILEEQRFYRYATSLTSLDDPLQCPHDLNHEGELGDDLPVLFSGNNCENSGKMNCLDAATHSSIKPLISVFESSSDASQKAMRLSVVKKTIHSTPYHRYKWSKEFSESIEAKNLTINEKRNVEEKGEIAIKKESEDRGVESNSGFIESVEDLLVNKQFDENKVICSTTEQTWSDSKKQSKQNLKDKVDTDAAGVSAHEKKIPDTLSKKKKFQKSKIILGRKKMEFKPFDFQSVDFKKYQSSTAGPGQKKKKLLLHKRGKKTGKKGFGISI